MLKGDKEGDWKSKRVATFFQRGRHGGTAVTLPYKTDDGAPPAPPGAGGELERAAAILKGGKSAAEAQAATRKADMDTLESAGRAMKMLGGDTKAIEAKILKMVEGMGGS